MRITAQSLMLFHISNSTSAHATVAASITVCNWLQKQWGGGLCCGPLIGSGRKQRFCAYRVSVQAGLE